MKWFFSTIIVLLFPIIVYALSANSSGSVSLIVGYFCGDGSINLNEECDDSNQNNSDGCNNSCLVEQDYASEIVGKSSKSVITSSGNAKIEIPNNTFSEDNLVTISGVNNKSIHPLYIEENDLGINTEPISPIYNINSELLLQDSATINLYYSPTNATNPDIYFYNDATDTWIEQNANCSNGLCTLIVNNFGNFVVIGEKTQTNNSNGSSVIIGMTDSLQIYDINIQVTKTNAIISWVTNKKVSATLEWGKTTEFMQGKTKEVQKNTQHQTTITNLNPETIYYFKISATDNYGHKAESKIKTFITLKNEEKIDQEENDIIDTHAPANITNFQATPQIDSIELTWTNPIDNDFLAVKILRSNEFYPTNINNGIRIYNGEKENYIDKNIEINKVYYYTAFAYDNDSNYASGAIAFAAINLDQIPEYYKLPVLDNTIQKINNIKKIIFDIENFKFIVDNQEIALNNNEITLSPLSRLAINIEFDKIPQEASVIGLNIDNDNYLFKQVETIYQALVTVPQEIKKYDITLIILDSDNIPIWKKIIKLNIKEYELIEEENKITQNEKKDNETKKEIEEYNNEILAKKNINKLTSLWYSLSLLSIITLYIVIRIYFNKKIKNINKD